MGQDFHDLTSRATRGDLGATEGARVFAVGEGNEESRITEKYK